MQENADIRISFNDIKSDIQTIPLRAQQIVTFVLEIDVVRQLYIWGIESWRQTSELHEINYINVDGRYICIEYCEKYFFLFCFHSRKNAQLLSADFFSNK